MVFWKLLWTVLLFGSLGAFAVLVVVVTIGGFRDLRKMFQQLGDRHDP